MLRSAMIFTVMALSRGNGLRATSEPTVSSAWLSQHLADRDLVILFMGRQADYDKGHITGARFALGGLESDDMGSSMDMSVLPAATVVRTKLEHLGVSDRSHVVVVYAGNGMPTATRMIYLAHYAGFDNISLLDGGMVGWQRADLPVTQAVTQFVPGKITTTTTRSPGVDRTWVAAHLNSPGFRIIDARDTSYFAGPTRTEMGMLGGHIPGAHNVPYWSLLTDAGVLRTPAEITAKFRAAGVQPGDTVVAYCHVGIQATTVVFAARLIGQPVTMYIGSYHDWSANKMPSEGGK
jgi:thiosulfate/3-mercaptopyruvate sulfurtransferase